jgi:predicted Zn-dependent protease
VLAAAIAARGALAAEAPPRFSGFASAADEVAVGHAERAAIVAQFGGEPASIALRRYVADLGETLARGAARPDAPLSFTVLDSPVLLSFATPGGFVYVTRGLIELADSEAELAAVLAHEIGHEAAQHYPRRDRRTVLANLRLAGLGEDHALGPLLAVGALPTFTHDEEIDADTIAARVLAESGYDVGALVRMIAKLQAAGRLAAALGGEDGGAADPFGWLAAHPVWDARLARLDRLALRDDGGGRATTREALLDRIDGLPFGAGAGRAEAQGRRFLDPAARVRFEAPPGFHLFALPHGAVAFGPRGARLVFDLAQDQPNATAEQHLTNAFARGEEIGPATTLEIDGMEAATATARGRTDAGEADVRLVAIRGAGGTFYRFLIATPPEQTAALDPALRRTVYGLRRVTEDEARAMPAPVLRVVTVAPGDTLEALAARMPFADHARERFEVLNGLSPGAAVAPGERVKIVTAAPPAADP